jgi:hypothetical protein
MKPAFSHGLGQKRSYSSPLTSPASVSSTLVSSCPIFMMLLTVSWAPTIWVRRYPAADVTS